MEIKRGGRHWIAKDTLYTHPKKGGIRMIDLTELITSIKCSWMKIYALGKSADLWADMLDTHFNLNFDSRNQILEYGPEHFNMIIKLNLPGISSLFKDNKQLKTLFPADPSSLNNSWLTQPIFLTPISPGQSPTAKQLHPSNQHFMGYMTFIRNSQLSKCFQEAPSLKREL